MQPKSKIAAGLFALLLGPYGVHNFYMGYTGKAVCQLVLTIVGAATSYWIVGLIPTFAVCIWTMVEGIQILAKRDYYDARGVRLEWHPQ